jgi:hypothetical protein
MTGEAKEGSGEEKGFASEVFFNEWQIVEIYWVLSKLPMTNSRVRE